MHCFCWTIIKYLLHTTLQIILGEVTRLGDLVINPCINVKRMAETKKVRPILTMDEYKKLFDKNTLEEIWNGQLVYFTITLLGAFNRLT